MARDAKVLQQQVPGEYVRHREILNRLAVVEQGQAGFGEFVVLKEQVERRQSTLRVEMVDDDLVAVEPHCL